MPSYGGNVTYTDVRTYLGSSAPSYTDAEILAALDAEDAAQRSACKVPALPSDYSSDLREALLRRVVRNLALRRLPLGFQDSISEAGPIRIGSTDPEVRRLEGPFKKRVVG